MKTEPKEQSIRTLKDEVEHFLNSYYEMHANINKYPPAEKNPAITTIDSPGPSTSKIPIPGEKTRATHYPRHMRPPSRRKKNPETAKEGVAGMRT